MQMTHNLTYSFHKEWLVEEPVQLCGEHQILDANEYHSDEW